MVDRAIRVLLADDHQVVRIGLRTLISAKPDLDVVGEVADGISAVIQAQRLLAGNVLVLDLVMPWLDGVQVIEQSARRPPRCGSWC